MTRPTDRELAALLRPFAHFYKMWTEKPLRLGGATSPTIYGIHVGTEWEAELHVADFKAASEAFAALEAEDSGPAPATEWIDKEAADALQLLAGKLITSRNLHEMQSESDNPIVLNAHLGEDEIAGIIAAANHAFSPCNALDAAPSGSTTRTPTPRQFLANRCARTSCSAHRGEHGMNEDGKGERCPDGFGYFEETWTPASREPMPAWEERVERAAEARSGIPLKQLTKSDRRLVIRAADTELRAAFPEYAPTETP